MRTLCWLLLMLAGAGCAQISPVDSGSLAAKRMAAATTTPLQYWLYLPESYAEAESWPLLLFLHGYGERGDQIERVKLHGPPKLISQGNSYPFVMVAPQDPRGWWEPLELTALLDEIERDYRIDKDRIYVTGLSLGGFGTWELAHFTPDRFAAIAPICGGGEVFWADEIAHLPVWAFHGAEDSVVPLARTTDMINAIKEKGGSPKLTIYPEVDHNSWTATYDNPELYKWLLEQRRVVRETPE